MNFHDFYDYIKMLIVFSIFIFTISGIMSFDINLDNITDIELSVFFLEKLKSSTRQNEKSEQVLF